MGPQKGGGGGCTGLAWVCSGGFGGGEWPGKGWPKCSVWGQGLPEVPDCSRV